MNPTLKKVLIGAAIVAASFVLYLVLFGGSEEPALSSETPSGLPAEEGGELLSLLLQLKSITLNEGIFADGAFQTLEDFTVKLVPEPVGRKNPFAPIGSVEASNTGTTTEPL